MALDRERLISTFSHWGLEVTRSDARATEDLIRERAAKSVITDIGIPERVGGHITLHDFTEGPETVAELLGNPESAMQRAVGDHICLGTGDGILLMNSETGEVYSWKDRQTLRISSSLANFVEFLMLIQEKLNIAEDENWPESSEEASDAYEQLVHAFREIDDAAMDEAGDYWRETIRASFGSMGF
ncbi:SUKH-4 family immunity protein [Streptomyces pactum]|uniref:SUKH-4 family immunity protein n=1 Tax=Streptomyces pactum TaxID=68249 RepID=A0ABS0NGK2_9ACTN|nr:SUKH-4 family immunity protein [Streptomyces pactum]MBH5334319.1 SUKH-4 family immunity protein [Streptomyces pactum]